MNSWGNDKLEELIDDLLTSSVSSGAEPKGYQVRCMSRRPVFPWISVAYVLLGAVILSFFFAQWLEVQNLENINYVSLFSIEKVTELFSGVTTSGLISSLAIILGLGGAIVTFLPERQQTLKHLL